MIEGILHVILNKYQNTKTAQVMVFGAVYKFLYPLKESSNKSNRIHDAKLQLIENSNIIKNLKNVLSGDFSWLSGFIKEREQENKILNFILNLDYNNPIKKGILGRGFIMAAGH